MKSRNKNLREQNFQVGVWITSSILLLLVLWIGTGFVFTDISSISCIDRKEISVDAKIYKANPARVVVEPWRGEQNVYALFVLPDKYLQSFSEYHTLVTVRGSEEPLEVRVADLSLFKKIEIPEGHFAVVAYFWTRQSVWMMLQGKHSELQYPCSWTLYLSEHR
jgi:hypothetical protein